MGSYIHDNVENERDHVTGSGGTARAVIADLKLKLAMKEAEIQKLQATAVARAAAQQKHIAGEWWACFQVLGDNLAVIMESYAFCSILSILELKFPSY